MGSASAALYALRANENRSPFAFTRAMRYFPSSSSRDCFLLRSTLYPQFFDYVAECVEMFKSAMKLGDEEFPLGFCFSFPVETEGLTKGVLTQWTKGFNVSGVVGKDVVALLQQALDKRNVSFSYVSL